MPNDEPKISPGVMKAAEDVIWYIYADLDESDPSNQKWVKQRTPGLADIIDAATHLTAKEAALRELIKVVEDVEAGRCCWTQMGARLATVRTFEDVKRRRGAVLAKAKKVMEL